MEKGNKSYEDSILKFLKLYRIKHGSSKTMELMQDIIQKKPISHLSNDLQKMGSDKLSEELSKIILKQIRSDIPDKYNMTPLLPSILNNHMTVSNQKGQSRIDNVRFIKRSFVKATIIACTTMVIGASTPSIANTGDIHSSQLVSQKPTKTPKKLQVTFSNLSKDNTYELKRVTDKGTNQQLIIPPVTVNPTKKPVLTQEPTKVPSIDKLSKKKTNDSESSNKLEETLNEIDNMKEPEEKEDKKEEVLNDFHKCKTISSILKRQKELEGLKLKKKDKLYKNCKLSAPLQRFIYEQSLAWNITSPDFTFAIIDTETRGGFGSSGSKTYNKSSNTNDLGLTQQNDYYRVRPFAEAYGISYGKAKKLVQHNDYVNIVCAFLEYQEIASHFDEFNPTEYAGCYNGWLKWRNISGSRHYVNLFQNAYQNKYTKYHKVKSISITKKGKNKVYIKK